MNELQWLYDLANLLSVLACLAIFVCYLRLPEKTFGYKLVLTLSIFDFVFHLTNFIPKEKESVSWIYRELIWLKDFAICESAYWTAHMAFLVYKSFNGLERKQRNKYSGFRFLYIVLPTLLLTLCTMIPDRLLRPWEYYGIIWCTPKVLAIILTTFFYMKTSLLLKNYPAVLQHAVKGTIRFLALYPIIQALTLFQFAIKIMVPWEYLSKLPGFVLTTSDILYNLVGFSNAALFFIQIKKTQNFAIQGNGDEDDEEEEVSYAYLNEKSIDQK